MELSPEEQLRQMGISAAMSAAYDVLDAAGLVREDRLKLCWAAEQQDRDPEAFARHLVKLCRTWQSVQKDRAQQSS